jgi:death-on-curing family protein
MIRLIELQAREVEGLNRRAIEDAHRKDSTCKQQHRLVRAGDLSGCLAGIFYQSVAGYMHLPIEKMAGLLLYRIAEGQFFMDGNKRTGIFAAWFFLANNGYSLHMDENRLNDLIWGFSKDPATGHAKFSENDAIQYMFDNIMP